MLSFLFSTLFFVVICTVLLTVCAMLAFKLARHIPWWLWLTGILLFVGYVGAG